MVNGRQGTVPLSDIVVQGDQIHFDWIENSQGQNFDRKYAGVIHANEMDLMETDWRCHEQSGHPLPPIGARPQATSGSDQAKSGEPPLTVPMGGETIHMIAKRAANAT